MQSAAFLPVCGCLYYQVANIDQVPEFADPRGQDGFVIKSLRLLVQNFQPVECPF